MLETCNACLIDERTLVIEAVFIGENKSKITTTDGVFYSQESAIHLLEKACISYGSTMKGRTDATKKVLNYSHKIPLIIVPFSVGVFPTSSSKDSTCIWIFNHPFEVEELKKGQSQITFISGESIIIPVSKHTLEKQKHRLHAILDTYRTMHERMKYNLQYGKRMWFMK